MCINSICPLVCKHTILEYISQVSLKVSCLHTDVHLMISRSLPAAFQAYSSLFALSASSHAMKSWSSSYKSAWLTWLSLKSMAHWSKYCFEDSGLLTYLKSMNSSMLGNWFVCINWSLHLSEGARTYGGSVDLLQVMSLYVRVLHYTGATTGN